MEAIPMQWLHSMPPVTKSYVLLSVALSIADYTGFIKSTDLMLNSNTFTDIGQIWKIPLNVVYNGTISLDFFTKVYFFTRYSNWLETSFASSYSYLWMASILIVLINLYCAFIVNLVMLGPTLKTALLYVWTKRNPNVEVLLFVILMKSVWVPWVSLLLDISLSRRNNDIKFWLINLAGIFIGHIFWFVDDQIPSLFKIKSPFRPFWEWKVDNDTEDTIEPADQQPQQLENTVIENTEADVVREQRVNEDIAITNTVETSSESTGLLQNEAESMDELNNGNTMYNGYQHGSTEDTLHQRI